VSYQIATAISGTEVRLHEDVLEAILRKHGELRSMVPLILGTVRSPDLVLAGHGKELLAVKRYLRTPFDGKDMVVVYREDRHLVITAFLVSNRLKLVRKRTVLWRK
jgi:hypothetical protein